MRRVDVRGRTRSLLVGLTVALSSLLVPWAAGGNEAPPLSRSAEPVLMQAAAAPVPAALVPTTTADPRPVAATATARPATSAGDVDTKKDDQKKKDAEKKDAKKQQQQKAPKKQLKVSIKPKAEVLSVQTRPGKRTVALTFDDGPDPLWTPRVLAALRRNNAVATFCTVGERVVAHPELVTDVVDAGMRLCDHTRSHPQPFTGLAVVDQHEQILDGRSALAGVTKAAVPYLRAPGGDWSPEILTFAVKNRMQPLDWSVDPRDWSLPGAQAIVSTVQAQVQPGSIILFHDGGGDRQQTLDALDTLLPWLVDQGYRFTFPTP